MMRVMGNATTGTRIRLRRQELGMTQAQLAARIGPHGVHPATVMAWEKDRNFPGRHQGALEAVLGISLSGDDPPAESYTDPNEQKLWGLEHLSPTVRRGYIARYRADVRQLANVRRRTA